MSNEGWIKPGNRPSDMLRMTREEGKKVCTSFEVCWFIGLDENNPDDWLDHAYCPPCRRVLREREEGEREGVCIGE